MLRRALRPLVVVLAGLLFVAACASASTGVSIGGTDLDRLTASVLGHEAEVTGAAGEQVVLSLLLGDHSVVDVASGGPGTDDISSVGSGGGTGG